MGRQVHGSLLTTYATSRRFQCKSPFPSICVSLVLREVGKWIRGLGASRSSAARSPIILDASPFVCPAKLANPVAACQRPHPVHGEENSTHKGVAGQRRGLKERQRGYVQLLGVVMIDSVHATNSPCSSWGNRSSCAQPRECTGECFRRRNN